MTNTDKKIILSEVDIPESYYNIQADIPFALDPPMHPGTKQPIGPADLAVIFPMEIIKQEVSKEKYIPIPVEVRDAYRIYRPTPLVRAERLEKALKTNCKIYFKNESVSPVGSHKLNTALAQAYYNKKEGVKYITSETGAGQWGSAIAFACNIFGLGCKVYMVKCSYEQKPLRKSVMKMFGAKVFASPSNLTQSGRAILEKDPNCTGSLGIAISEAVEEAAQSKDTKYSLGSVLNHVLLHQTIIGQEAIKQLDSISEKADTVIGCVGGGSNFAGLCFPFLSDKLKKEGKYKDIKAIAVEPTACPSLTKGKFAYDFGDTAGLTPLIKMHSLGAAFMPQAIHAAGLRYHGMSPLVSALYKEGFIDAKAYNQSEVFEAAILFAKAEGIIPAVESSHAVKAAIDEAKKNDGKTIVFNLSGHGFLDISSYDAFMEGKLKDIPISEEEINKAQASMPQI
ncbi:MAG: TrpB-like pyridoxal phosphate-dependent enzyme [archaeon]